MTEEAKVAEAPVVETPKASEGEPIIENRRTEIEKLVNAENNIIDVPSEVPEVLKKEEPKTEEDPVERIKKSVQKRIDKVVAQKKSVEEELAETRAELERLKSNPEHKSEPAPKDDTPPTPEQVEAYIVKMREEGNVKEEVAAMRYLVKLEKELALKEVRDEQTKVKSETDKVKSKQLEDWTYLQKDYIAYDADGKPDASSDLTLANEKGLLYKTAMSLFKDKELHKDFYNDQDVIRGFRRAVSDAYREIHQQGLIKTPKADVIIPEKKPRMVLADPSADSVEEDSTPSNSNSLSDAEKVREELKARSRNRFKR
jgi:hypothetical protein